MNGMKIKVSELRNAKDEVIGIHVETGKDVFTIPVADVRRNRKQANAILKSANIHAGSKFIRPSYSLLGYSYNLSMKSNGTSF